MLGDFGLGKTQNILKMADANRALSQQVYDSQPVRVTEALVDLDQLHEESIFAFVNIRQCKYTEGQFYRRISPFSPEIPAGCEVLEDIGHPKIRDI